MRRYRRARLLQNRNRCIPLDGWEISQKLIQRITCFEIVEKIFHGHTNAAKNRHAALNLGINGNDSLFHIEASTFDRHMIRRQEGLRRFTRQQS
jgi:hypothetical protein